MRSFPRSVLWSDAPSAAASTRWSTLDPRTTVTITATDTTARRLPSPRPLPTSSSPSTATSKCTTMVMDKGEI